MSISIPYIAGFFDGEGCVSIFYTKIRLQKSNPEKMIRGIKLAILVSNTDQRPLLEIQAMYGGYIYCSNIRKKPHHKSVYSLRISDREAQKRFLNVLLPYSIIKNEQIRIALEYLSTKGLAGHRLTQEEWNIRISCLERLIIINKRGHGAPRATPPSQVPVGQNPLYR